MRRRVTLPPIKVATGSQIPIPTEVKQERPMTTQELTDHRNSLPRDSQAQNLSQATRHNSRATSASALAMPKASQKKNEILTQNETNNSTKSDNESPEHDRTIGASGQRGRGRGGRRGRAPWFRGRRGRGSYRGGSSIGQGT